MPSHHIAYKLTLTPDEAKTGCHKTITYKRQLPDGQKIEQLTVPVPAEVKNGQRASLKGKGHQFTAKEPIGNLHIQIAIVHSTSAKITNPQPQTNLATLPSSPTEQATQIETQLASSSQTQANFDQNKTLVLSDTSTQIGHIWPTNKEGVTTQSQTAEPSHPKSEPHLKQQQLFWQPGEIVADFYEIKEMLGRGGMGAVHRVYHRHWGMDLAVKTPSDHILRSAGGRERFQEREAREWVQLGLHPHLASCYYVRTLADNIPRIFIEYVEGGDLATWLERGKITSIEMALDIAIQICWGVGYAHQKGLVHRDLKPANILMTKAGTPKITDFGLIKPLQQSSFTDDSHSFVTPDKANNFDSTLPAGTPGYSSPEQFDQAGESTITPAADVYALGVILYQMVAPHVMLEWPAQTHPLLRAQILWQTLDQEKPQNSQLNQFQWDVFTQLLRRCLDPKPENRHATGAELAHEIQVSFTTLTGQPYYRSQPDTSTAVADGLNNQAVSLMDLNHLDQARMLWAQALETQFDHPEATYNLGLMQWRMGEVDHSELVERLRQVILARPLDWKPAHLLAKIYLEEGHTKAASKITTLLKTLFLDTAEITQLHETIKHGAPYHAPLELARGLSGEVMARFEQSLAAARQAIEKEEFETAAKYIRQARSIPSLNREKRAVALWQSLYTHLTRADYIDAWSDRALLGHTAGVHDVCLSYDGKYAVSGSADHTVKLWDIETGQCIHTFEGHTNIVTSVAITTNPHGQLIAASGSTDGTIRIWDIDAKRCLHTLTGANTDPIRAICLDGAGNYLFSSSHEDLSEAAELIGRISIWSATTGQLVQETVFAEGEVFYINSLSLSLDERQLLACGISMKQAPSLPNEPFTTYRESAAISTIFHLYDEYDARSTDLQEPSIKTFRLGAEESMHHKHLIEDQKQLINTAVFNTNGVWLLSGGSDKLIKLWNVYESTGNPIRKFGGKAGHQRSINSATFTSDSRHIISGSNDHTVKIWSVETGECVATYRSHLAPVTSVCVSCNGQVALSASEDHTIHIWNFDWELQNYIPEQFQEELYPYLVSFSVRSKKDNTVSKPWLKEILNAAGYSSISPKQIDHLLTKLQSLRYPTIPSLLYKGTGLQLLWYYILPLLLMPFFLLPCGMVTLASFIEFLRSGFNSGFNFQALIVGLVLLPIFMFGVRYLLSFASMTLKESIKYWGQSRTLFTSLPSWFTASSTPNAQSKNKTGSQENDTAQNQIIKVLREIDPQWLPQPLLAPDPLPKVRFKRVASSHYIPHVEGVEYDKWLRED